MVTSRIVQPTKKIRDFIEQRMKSVSSSASTNISARSEAFPVGSVFLTAAKTNPATLLGYGTWVEIVSGKVPMIDSGIIVYVWERI